MLVRLTATAFLFVFVIGYPVQAHAQTPGVSQKAVHQISVEEIGKSVVLIGRLGVPLGQKMEIVGYWQAPKFEGKANSTRFVVTIVNGMHLPKPVPFDYYQLRLIDTEHNKMVVDSKSQKMLDGQTWILAAYETGRIHIVPNESGVKSPVFLSEQMPYYTRPFTSELVGVVQQREVPE